MTQQTTSTQRTAGIATAFWHVGLSVADLDRSIAFYRDGLGLELRSRGFTSSAAPTVWGAGSDAHGEVVFLGLPGGPDVVELFQISGVPQVDSSSPPWDFGSAHLCLVTDDLESLFAHMAELGYGARSAHPVRSTSGVLAGGLAVYFVDPDGFHVEVIQRPAAPSL